MRIYSELSSSVLNGPFLPASECTPNCYIVSGVVVTNGMH